MSNIHIIHRHERHPAPSLNSLKMRVPSSFFCDLQQGKLYFTVCYPFIDKAIYFHSFGPCFPRFVFHQISAVVVASLSFAALSPHLVLRWKQRSYCSKIQSSFCFLPCRTSMDSPKVLFKILIVVVMQPVIYLQLNIDWIKSFVILKEFEEASAHTHNFSKNKYRLEKHL